MHNVFRYSRVTRHKRAVLASVFAVVSFLGAAAFAHAPAAATAAASSAADIKPTGFTGGAVTDSKPMKWKS